MAAELKFEDLDAFEQRVDVEDPAGADESVGGSPGHPAATDVPNPPVVEEKCRQDLPGLQVDVIHGKPTDVRSLVCAAPECDSPGVQGCQVDPIASPVSWALRPGMNGDGCSGNQSEKGHASGKGDLFNEVDQSQSNDDISMRYFMKLMNQAEAKETRELDRENMSIVKSLGGNSSNNRRERSRQFVR